MTAMARTAEDSFDEVFRREETRVLRTAWRILGNLADAEEVAQEAFFRLHRQGLNFPDEAALRAWLYRVTVNLCLDRKRTARPPLELSDMRSGEPSPEVQSVREQEKAALTAALAELPARERAAIVLREIEGLTTSEVAAIMGTAEVTVRSQVANGIARLKERMTGETR